MEWDREGEVMMESRLNGGAGDLGTMVGYETNHHYVWSYLITSFNIPSTYLLQEN